MRDGDGNMMIQADCIAIKGVGSGSGLVKLRFLSVTLPANSY